MSGENSRIDFIASPNAGPNDPLDEGVGAGVRLGVTVAGSDSRYRTETFDGSSFSSEESSASESGSAAALESNGADSTMPASAAGTGAVTAAVAAAVARRDGRPDGRLTAGERRAGAVGCAPDRVRGPDSPEFATRRRLAAAFRGAAADRFFGGILTATFAAVSGSSFVLETSLKL